MPTAPTSSTEFVDLLSEQVTEVIVAVPVVLRVMAFSVVTDVCLPNALKPVNVDEIIAVARGAEPKLRTLISGIVAGETEPEA